MLLKEVTTHSQECVDYAGKCPKCGEFPLCALFCPRKDTLTENAHYLQCMGRSAIPRKKKEGSTMSTEAPVAEATTATGRRRAFSENDVITIKVEANPKREGSAAHTRFALYKSGMTVKQFLEAGGQHSDLQHDTEREFISIERMDPPAAEAGTETASEDTSGDADPV